MKKLNIFMSRLKYGGMELSLINFINNSNITKQYEVNLYLVYCLNKELLNNISKNVNIYLFCNDKWNILGKIKAMFSILKLLIVNPKSDVSICYSNHQRILSKLCRKSSDNSILFIHSDLDRYTNFKERNEIKDRILFDKFNKIVCVSEKTMRSLVALYDDSIADKCFVIPNYVDGERILEMSNEKIEESIDFSIPTFISIANHVEKYKNINSIIYSAYELKKKKLDFQILLIGSGEDTENYKTKIEELRLQDTILLLGSKSNPYPYLKKSKALLFTSSFEGYGMVLDEARVLNVPIISTGSGASVEICHDGYGVIVEDLTIALNHFLEKNIKNKKMFDYNTFNNDITKAYDEVIK